MKYRCTFDYPVIETIIEAEDREEAEELFWKRNDLSEIEWALSIKQYKKRTKEGRVNNR